MGHISVLLEEAIAGLHIKDDDVVFDGTLGGGGHALSICKSSQHITLIGTDLDKDGVTRAKKLLQTTLCRTYLFNTNFRDIDKILHEVGVTSINRALFDLGLSSYQLEEKGRGFSFQRDEPLLMTMKKNPEKSDLSAYDVVNTWSEEN